MVPLLHIAIMAKLGWIVIDGLRFTALAASIILITIVLSVILGIGARSYSVLFVVLASLAIIIAKRFSTRMKPYNAYAVMPALIGVAISILAEFEIKSQYGLAILLVATAIAGVLYMKASDRERYSNT